MDFSGVIKLADLDDFLAPAQNCSVTSNMIKTTAQKTASVSLSDCLACSGCVTSAETVLMQQQSTEEFLSQLDSKRTVVSISQQSLLSLARHYGLGVNECFGKLSAVLKSWGVYRVTDMIKARDEVLLGVTQEFSRRLETGQLPVLCSECPGWTCFVEKKADAGIIPLLSHIKTPMQVQRQFLGLLDEYHVCIMPCFDKKLEAALSPGVDTVLTTSEIASLLQAREVDLQEVRAEDTASSFYTTSVQHSSHGYAELILNYAQQVLGASTDGVFRKTRRRDLEEAVFRIGEREFKVARASGFQNIQNLVRNLKRQATGYAYVEVMACPTGCLNGGGQLNKGREAVLELLKGLEEGVSCGVGGVDLSREFRAVEGRSLQW
mmetsp:Transcript_15644/g.28463  ORF Transcript_15644/g.28463 Transcript_15644/m.28463 type:complete len:378 (+) Transcript_15644:1309-2442(+)